MQNSNKGADIDAIFQKGIRQAEEWHTDSITGEERLRVKKGNLLPLPSAAGSHANAVGGSAFRGQGSGAVIHKLASNSITTRLAGA